MRPKVAILAEAGRQVGYGHLKEVLALGGALRRLDISPELWVKGQKGFRAIRSLSPEILKGWAGRAALGKAKALVIDLCDLRLPQSAALCSAGLPVLVIDDRGKKTLKADVIVNPLLLPRRHRYPATRARLYKGPLYLALDPSYQQAHRKRPHRGPLRDILISFGGGDRTGATLRAARILRSWRPWVHKKIVLGPGFRFRPQLESILKDSPSGRFKLISSVPSLAPLLADADVVLSAGGNTLCEAACLGTPAIVAYEDPHEKEHGEAFQAKGFGLCIGKGKDLKAEGLIAALERFDDPALRRRHAAAGRRLVDGGGSRRIAGLVRRLVFC